VSDRRRGGDADVDALFDEGEDREVAREIRRYLTSLPRPPAEPDPAFRAALRRRLLTDSRWPRAAPAPWYRTVFGPTALAGIGALAVTLLLFVLTATFGGQDGGVQVASPMDHAQKVSVVQPITLTFDRPMDARSTESAVAIQPETRVAYRWTSPRTLEIAPQDGSLAPATRYQVTVRPTARTADQRPLSREVRISFVTGPQLAPTPAAPTPVPTVSPAPTPSATPSASASPRPSPSPSASPSPSGSPSPSVSPSVSPQPTLSPTASPSPRCGILCVP
jgi:hypothetical protein